MSSKKGVRIFRPFRALMETPVILSIGRCPMIVAMSPLGSKMPEIYLSNYLASSVVLANLQIYEFTHLRLQAGRKPILLNPPSPRGTSTDESFKLRNSRNLPQ